ncbi:MAG: ferrochelatase [Ilumatobacteraceae bacterium]|nr:ferrochelatase [Ilumatobacteraceae bacterium]
MSNAKTAVLLMAYGTPRSREEILPYYTDIRRGRVPTEEQLSDLTARYEAIGGLSPLAALTESQRDALQIALNNIAPNSYHVALGLKHAAPMIEDAVQQLATEGFTKIIALVLAPHYSSFSIGQYIGRATEAATPHGISVVGITSWATEEAFIAFLAADMSTKLAAMPTSTHVLFTAHSLPQRIIDAGDPYPAELRSTAVAVAAKLGLEENAQWSIAWQSAGRTPEPWIGPDILDVIDALATQTTPVAGVLVSACGFVADHLEVLFDLDIEALHRAQQHGLAFARTECVNDNEAIMNALAHRVHAANQ